MREITRKDTDDMPLLSKLLAQERHIPDIPAYDLYNKIYTYLQKEIPPILATLSYAHKVELWQRIEHIFDHLEFGLQWPDLLGKTMIGIMPLGKGRDVESCSRVLKEFVTPEVGSHLLLNNDVTTLLLPSPSFEGIRFFNTAWHIGELTNKEYRGTTHELWQDGVEIGQLLECFVFGNAIPSCEHLAFTWLPMFRNCQLPLYNLICENLDCLVIFPPTGDGNWTSVSNFQYALEFCAKKGIPVVLAVEDLHQADCLQSLQGLLLDMVKIVALEDVPALFRKVNVPCCHYCYTVCLRQAFFDIKREAFRHQQECNEDLLQMKEDLNFLSQAGTKEQILQCRSDIQKELREEEQTLQQLHQVFIGLFQQIKQLEAQLSASCDAGENDLRLPDALLMAQLVREYIETGQLKEAKNLSCVLEQADFPYAYILPLLAQKQRGTKISAEGLERLKQQGDNEFVRHAKLALIKELGFSEQDAMQIARDIRTLDTSAEIYYRGIWEERIQNYDEAAHLYELAYHQGFQPAGKGIMRLVQDVKFLPLARAARMMVPEACLLYGKELLQDKRYAKADMNLKIAAGNGMVEAIDILARNFWQRIIRNYYKDIPEEEMRNKLVNCRKLFEILKKKYPQDESITETLGFIYLRMGDEQRALSTWLTCHTATARYRCGRLYEYPSGTFPQDLDKAAAFFAEATKLGSKKAEVEYSKVRRWKRKNAQEIKSRMRYQSTNNYSTRTESTRNNSDDSFCFITTAVCRALHKDDDCEELMIMRHFRDDVQAKDPLLKEMIREYYRVAPEIIECIQASGKADMVYQELWTDNLCPILYNLRHHAYRQAALGYIAMVERLSQQYGVPFQPDIEQDITVYRQRESWNQASFRSLFCGIDNG